MKSGPGTAWVAFEVDASYPVGSVFFAQRNGANTGDNMQKMSIWANETGAFPTAQHSYAIDDAELTKLLAQLRA